MTVVGQRKTGLGSLDTLPMTEIVELDSTDHNAVTENDFHRIDRLEYSNAGLTIDTAADLDIVSDSKLKKTAFSARDLIFPGLDGSGHRRRCAAFRVWCRAGKCAFGCRE